MGDVPFDVADDEPPWFDAVTRTRSRAPRSDWTTRYVFAVALAICTHVEIDGDVQLSHWYVNRIGCDPVQAPSVAVMVAPTRVCPVVSGATVFTGADGAVAEYVTA